MVYENDRKVIKIIELLNNHQNFHKFGSTLPVVDFGHEKKRHGHVKTFVPMKDEKIPVIE